MTAIAIDGPAGAGKSSIARRAAKEIGYIYVDTGALYRAIGLFMLNQGVDTTKGEAVCPLLEKVQVSLTFQNQEQKVILCGKDVSDEIRTGEVSMAASNVSAIPQVREFLFSLQKDIAEKNDVIMDGRDIGTVVLPDAQVKIFLTASPEERAKRRYDEMTAMGEKADYDTVLGDLKTRDYNDSNRAVAPLVPAKNAVIVDTTGNTLEQSVEQLLLIIKSHLQIENNDKITKRMPFYSFGKIFCQWIVQLFIPYHVNNKENLPEKGRVIVCCNHIGMSDAVRLAFTQHRQIYFMSKAELFQNKAMALLLRMLGAFPVQRGKGDKQAINRAKDLLLEGQVLGLFIEGTRSKDGNLLQPKAGAVLIAHKYHTPILPCCITAQGGGVPRTFHKCIVSYGELIQPEDLGIVDGTGTEYRAACRLVMEKIAALRERDIKVFQNK